MGESMMFIMLILYSGIQLTMTMGIVTAAISIIYARFVLFNRCIRKVFEHHLISDGMKVASFRISQAIFELIDIHDKIMNEYELMSARFGLLAGLGYGIVWTYTLCASFTVYKMLFDDTFEFTNSIIFNIMWCIYLNFYVFSIMLECTLLNFEFRTSLKLLRKITKNSTINPRHLEQLEALANQIQKRPAIFTAGLFDFQWNFVFSVSSLLH